MQYFIFFVLKLFETSGIKLIKLRIRINFIISSNDLPYIKSIRDIYTTNILKVYSYYLLLKIDSKRFCKKSS